MNKLENSRKTEGGKKFVIESGFKPAGDQPHAIQELLEGLKSDEKNQVLLGVIMTHY